MSVATVGYTNAYMKIIEKQRVLYAVYCKAGVCTGIGIVQKVQKPGLLLYTKFTVALELSKWIEERPKTNKCVDLLQ